MEMFGTPSRIEIVGFCVGTVVLFSVYWYVTDWFIRRYRNLPPGPYGLPLLGYLPFLGGHVAKRMDEVAEKYGDVFSIYMGSQLVVVLNSFDAIKEAFIKQGDVFCGKPEFSAFSAGKERNISMGNVNGPLWREHRRFAVSTLRDFGMGKTSLEPKLLDEVRSFLLELYDTKGSSLDVSSLLGISVTNNICQLVFGKRFDYRNKTLRSIKHNLDVAMRAISSVSIRIFFPWTNSIPFISKLSGEQIILASANEIQSFILKEMSDHRDVYNRGERRRDDYMHAYFLEQDDRKRKLGNKDDIFTDKALSANSHGLFAAGSETTSTFLLWALLYLTRYPDVQKKLQTEIDEVIGDDRAPSYDDRTRTPYTEAFIMEVHRIVTLVPLNTGHSNLGDARVKGYSIPNKSFILSNLWKVHHDPKLWTEPEVFKPERFIGKDKKVQKPEYLIPFSIGKRQCPGESLARMEIYLYLTALLQQFNVSYADSADPPPLDQDSGLIQHPKPYQLRLLPRNQGLSDWISK